MPFQPEAFTPAVAPANATNQLVNGAVWSSLSQALLPTPSNGATVAIPVGFTGITTYLQCAPLNAANITIIEPSADITQFIVAFQVFVTRIGIYQPGVHVRLMRAGAGVGSPSNSLGAIENTWLDKTYTFTKATHFPAGLTGQQIKDVATGAGFYDNVSNDSTGGNLRIRAVTISVGYRNPVPEVGGALLLCEA